MLEEASRSWTPLSPLAEGPPVTDSPSWSLSDSIAEENTGKGEALSLTQAAPSQPPQTVLPKGDASDNITYPPSAEFPAPLCEALDHQDLGAYPKNLDGSNSEGSVAEQWKEINEMPRLGVGLMPSRVFPIIPRARLLTMFFDKFFISPQSPRSLSSAPNLIEVPQRVHKHGNRKRDFKRSEPISSSGNGPPGINMEDVLRKYSISLDDQDDPTLQNAPVAITIRFTVRWFPRFPPHIRADVILSFMGTHLTSRV